MAHPDAVNDEGNQAATDVEKAQDFHSMLGTVLASYVELQETGFIWDLHYRGRVCKDIEFVLFTPFMKVDGDEADKLCGKYLCRTGNVAQICRYCECPTAESDNPLARCPFKTKAKIAGLIRENKRDALQELSQQCIINATYRIKFGSHNGRSVHGACPWEMLQH